MARLFLFQILVASLAVLTPAASAQGLNDAKVAFTSGNWKVLRSIDPMNDTTTCTGIYKDNYRIQLTTGMLFVGIQGGIQTVTLRFGDKPAQGMRLAEDMEKTISSVIISGSEFNELIENDRLRYQVGTLVGGLSTGELDLDGLRPALESVRAGCPIQAATEEQANTETANSSLCTPTLVSRMKTQGLREAQIETICRQ